MRRLLVLAALVGTLVPTSAASAVGTQAPEGQLGIRLLEAPENRRDDPRARIYIVDHLNQGDEISRRIEISNTTSEPADVSLYAGAASITDGSFAFGEGRAENELTGWTTVTPATVRVAPGSTATAQVEVAIPDDAADGERYAVVWAEQASAGDGSIGQVSRVGIRMYVSVGEGAEPPSDFTVEELTVRRAADGAPLVQAVVTNTGERALDMSGELRLSEGPGGLSAGPFDATLGATLAPGKSSPVEIVLDPALPDGPWTARIDLRSGELERAVEGSITFPDAGEAVSVKPEPVDDGGNAWAWIAAAVVGLPLGLLLLLLLRRRDESAETPQRP